MLAVTTSASADAPLETFARTLADRFKIPFVDREGKPLASLLVQAPRLLVVGKDGVTLWDERGKLRWSPGLAALRVKRFDAGARDDMLVRWAEFQPGDEVLDCTLGIAQDAWVAARAIGPTGRVVGLEASLALHAVVALGIERHPRSGTMAPIQARHAEAGAFLRSLRPRAFDVVLFDPMFERARPASGDFDTLRRFADYAPLTPAMVEQAQRVARRWVLIKASRYSKDLSKLGLRPLPGPRTATVVWARLEPR